MGQHSSALLVGCGGISRTWLEAIKDIPDLALVGLVDLVTEAAEQRAAEFGFENATISADLSAALKECQPDIVFDCTVPEAHVHVTSEALRHGCHVLSEKPMADSLENGLRMVATAQEAGKIYAVMQNRRYNPSARRLKSYLESGDIGKVTTVNSDFFIGAHFGGFRDRMEHVLLVDMAIHTFDIARFLTGADPVGVYCKEWNPNGSWYDHDASAIAIFEMSDGSVYSYHGSWCAEGLNTSWESEWRVLGEKGSAKWDGGDGFEAQVVAETGAFISELQDVEMPPFVDADKAGGHSGLIRDFVRCIRTGETPETVCTDNINSLAMVFGAVESSELGQPVQINL
jgi:predicted dehydrogenase